LLQNLIDVRRKTQEYENSEPSNY